MTPKQAWISFWILALIWGSSYLFIRIGVEQLPPFQLVFIRTAIAAVGLNLVVYGRGKRLPTDRRGWGDLLFLGIVNTVFPFALITWGETRIESGLASVLQGTAALFSLVIAHFLFADERITWRKVIGLLIGFFGVVVLASRSTGQADTETHATLHLLGQLAIVASSLCYAIGGAYSRKAMQNRLEPIVVAAGSMTVAALTTGINDVDLVFLAAARRHFGAGVGKHIWRLPHFLFARGRVGRSSHLDGYLYHSGRWANPRRALLG